MSEGEHRLLHSRSNCSESCNTLREKGNLEHVKRLDTVRRLKYASILCTLFLAVEVIGGFISGSLSILSDAAHLFADLASFLIAIMASHLASQPASPSYTFGLKRVEALAALFSVGSLGLVSIFLLVEAFVRLWRMSSPRGADEVDGKVMSAIAAFGVVVNILLALILGEDHVHLPGADHGHDHDHEHSHGHSHAHGHDHHDIESSGESNHKDKHDDGHEHAHEHENEHQHEHEHEHQHHDNEHQHNDHSDDHDHSHGHEHIHNDENTSLLSSKKHVDYTPNLDTAHSHECSHDAHTTHAPVKNINLSAAYLHVLGDLAMSVAVLIAGIIIWVNPKLQAADPICTIFFCVLVFKSTFGVIKSSVSVLLEEVPPNLDFETVLNAIASVKGICNVHELHIWSISHGIPALSVHVLVVGGKKGDRKETTTKVLQEVDQMLRVKFGISHSTIQVQIVNDESEAECITCKEQ